ncbi:MAG: hypothetical protein J7L94_13085, partial [Caldisericaceae bacterium]|nr:hypothetical protein [Caldisericaceae bacterium]
HSSYFTIVQNNLKDGFKFLNWIVKLFKTHPSNSLPFIKGKGEPEFWFVEIDLKELAISLSCWQGRVTEA